MNTVGWIIFSALLGIGIGGVVYLYFFRKRHLEKLFVQVFETSRQVPKQKKNSFLLLMFNESMKSSKRKSKKTYNANQFNNPKFLEIQLMQMSRILKDPANVKDKTVKKSLILLKDYLNWEKAKLAKDKPNSPKKVA